MNCTARNRQVHFLLAAPSSSTAVLSQPTGQVYSCGHLWVWASLSAALDVQAHRHLPAPSGTELAEGAIRPDHIFPLWV